MSQRVRLENLIEASGLDPASHDPACNAIGGESAHSIVGSNQRNRVYFLEVEATHVQAPLSHLFEEIDVTRPIFDGLEISLEPCTAFFANVVHDDAPACSRECYCGGQSGKPRAENLDDI